MAHGKQKAVKQRNFVAKNATKAGAGRHRDKQNDYNRQAFKRTNEENIFLK